MANVFLGTHVPIPFQPGRDGYVCLWRTCYGGSAPQPEEDLLTIIAQSKLNGELLPQEFLDGSWLLIIFAGNDTSRNSLSGTIRLMNEFPDQRAMVLEDPSLIPQMSEEALRMVSPVIHMRRTATEDAEINGQRIAKDEKVVLWYGAANRDPDIFRTLIRSTCIAPRRKASGFWSWRTQMSRLSCSQDAAPIGL